MSITATSYFPIVGDHDPVKATLFEDIDSIVVLIDQALRTDEAPTVGSVRYTDTFVEIKASIDAAVIRTPQIQRYLKFITNDLRITYRNREWDDLTMSIIYSTAEEGLVPEYEFVVKLTYR